MLGFFSNRVFASSLRSTIDIQGMNRVIRFVRPLRSAIKDIVRADIEELPTEFLRDASDISRAFAIDGKRLFGVPLTPVHVRVSSGKHDPVWMYLRDELPHLPYVTD